MKYCEIAYFRCGQFSLVNERLQFLWY